MRFEKIASDKIRIILTEQDLKRYNITYRQMEYSDPATRSLLQALLILAEEKAGFDCSDRSRLLIELFPAAGGGCSVVFTLLGKQENIRCCVYSFPKLEILIQCAVKAADLGCCPHPEGCFCALYRMERDYRILCRPAKYPSDCLPVLEEYGFPAGEGEMAAAYTEEHGTLLAAPDGLKRLADYLR